MGFGGEGEPPLSSEGGRRKLWLEVAGRETFFTVASGEKSLYGDAHAPVFVSSSTVQGYTFRVNMTA